MPPCGDTQNFAAYLLLCKAAQWPERVAARCDGKTLSYAALSRQAFSMAAFLRSRGLGPGSRVLIVLPDSFSFLAAFLGCLLAGIEAAPVNNRLRRVDYADCILGCSPGLVLAPDGHEALEAALEADIPALPLDDDLLSGILEGMAPMPFHPSRAEDLCVLFVTSGTTGHPKMVPHRHSDFFSVAEAMGSFLDVRPADVVLCSAKMCHAYGLVVSLVLPFMVGATTILDPAKPNPENTRRLLLDRQVTFFASVPAFYTLLLLSSFTKDRLDSLRVCFSAGETLPAAVYAEWLEKTGRPVWQAYGSTELMTFPIGCRPPDIVPGTAGHIIPPCEARIMDQEGGLAPDGVPGHLAVLAPSTMPGYLRDPEWSSRVFTPDGWLLTGDMAVRERGVYTILGRMDDMFKAGGLWVSPTRVENAFQSHPAVAQCAVTSGFAGAFSMVRAHVMLKPGWEPNQDMAATLRRHAAEALPDFMTPSEVLFHTTLPMTASGKVQRFKLRTVTQ
jgi:benzoate-CoA ligase